MLFTTLRALSLEESGRAHALSESSDEDDRRRDAWHLSFHTTGERHRTTATVGSPERQHSTVNPQPDCLRHHHFDLVAR